ncbi:hypothetical protein HS088_TW08G00753 [Tripterygium wilfordii]|uniref:Peroxisomal ATPase PEX6 n=1 Tax=Tripterygium wilfordii TaxID=458696 RepID=A0A7J7DCT6_TRIWF|nr:peroxisome biogenesis protein 6 [Tripterygium wilfordii]KAF5744157.1 hypothetical protein HS088_TW08G00753 [Tripterygium wilfordii]
MVERRKPLVLASTKVLIDSVLSSSRLTGTDKVAENKLTVEISSLKLQLPAGILRFSKDNLDPKQAALDDSALVGLSTSVLKRLSVTSGSLVLIKNVEANLQRVAQVVALDPPTACASGSKLPFSSSPRTMLIFPSFRFPQEEHPLLDKEVAYLSPLLAFNLDLHTSCLKSLVRQGNETLASLFEAKGDGVGCGEGSDDSVINLEVVPFTQLPRYASHLRASFVKIPECGTIESLKGSSSIEAEDRQNMIDLALNEYFKVDRYLASGDVFSIQINWTCNSIICISCSQRSQNRSDNIIYFKVVAIQPSDEAVLRINRSQTALVLGGSVPSSVPPDLLINGHKGVIPLQGDTVKILASILTPPLCPSALSSKFRVAVLLYGLAGCGKRTVVKYVARRLGLHVVEFSCHNLTVSSERKTSVALAQAFNTAQRYSPAILLLRHFDVFKSLASQEGLTNDQVGLTSEVASVIRKFTEPVAEDEDSNSKERLNGNLQGEVAEDISRHHVLFVAAAESSEGLPPAIRRCFSHEISMGPLTEEQRVEMLSQSLQSVTKLLSNTVSEEIIKDMVGQTSGFMPRDLHALIADAGAHLILRDDYQIAKIQPEDLDGSSSVIMGQDNKSGRAASQDSGKVADAGAHLIPMDDAEILQSESEDLERSSSAKMVQDTKSGKAASHVSGKEFIVKALERSKKRNASALGTPKVPNVKWEDVGGLEDVKKSILDTVQLPLLHKDLFSSGLRKRSGVLLYGPPGTGKTLLAKAVATECSLNFLSVKGPELINMYIGESEKNVRDIFQKARSARPCVIFFDELDSLAPARGASGDSGGVMDRVVSQMLAEIDGLNDSTQDLFIIGASNRPDLIDPALLRPGRFDKLLYVGVNSDPSYRERVLKALTRKFKLHDDVSLYSIAKKCSPNFTGADMYALCADAWFQAAKRKVSSSGSDSPCMDDQIDSVVVEYGDFVKVLYELSPSLSMAELKKYELLRSQFEGAPK